MWMPVNGLTSNVVVGFVEFYQVNLVLFSRVERPNKKTVFGSLCQLGFNATRLEVKDNVTLSHGGQTNNLIFHPIYSGISGTSSTNEMHKLWERRDSRLEHIFFVLLLSSITTLIGISSYILCACNVYNKKICVW
jgi:hypothetical protein